MAKNIAILIGVAKYVNEENLNPCQSDVELIGDIVIKSGKYSDCLVLKDSPKSIEGKEKISQFIRSNEGQEIEELFFYYSGHGSRVAEDFLYLFSDFNRAKIEQTSLRNSELDSMLRSLKPKLAVKVVDACQSGTEYVKSDIDMRGILEKSSIDSFGKTYFLFSSSNTQSSIALSDFSVFTRSFAEAVVKYKNSEVRFRDIMSYISDDERVKKYQTPLFILQANNTEVFCLVTDEIEQAISARFSLFSTKEAIEDHGHDEIQPKTFEQSVIDAARLKSAKYCNAIEAQDSLLTFVEKLEQHKWSPPLDSLYTAATSRQIEYSHLPKLVALADWLRKYPSDYFAKLTYREEAYVARERVESEKNAIATMYGLLNHQYEYKDVNKMRLVLDGIKQTAESPCCALIISLEPKELALPWFQLFVPFIFSRSTLTAFLRCEREKELSWDTREILNTGEWQTFHSGLKSRNEIIEMADAILNVAAERVLLEVAKSVGVSHEVDPNST